MRMLRHAARHILPTCAVLTLIIFASASARRFAVSTQGPARLPTASEYYPRQCGDIWQIYRPLIASALAPYKASNLSISGILDLHGWVPRPQVFVLNNIIRTFEKPVNNAKSALIPLLTKLSQTVNLPDLVLAGNPQDEPEKDILRHGGPWFGYCNHMMESTNVLYPADKPVKARTTCGESCKAFSESDRREPKAAFFGSSTGWHHGRRRAALHAGIQYPDQVHSGFTALLDLDDKVDMKDPAFSQVYHTMPMQKQVQKYKYIINADGNCAAHRLRHLLASDSVVFWIASDQVEWFYPLLEPFVHYVPIEFDANDVQVTVRDILVKLQWAEENPTRMAAMVQTANEFAEMHLTDHALTCYSVQLLDEYAKLFMDANELQLLAKQGALQNTYTHSLHWLQSLGR